jgi:hypothetical protein
LAKRWLASQLLSDKLAPEFVELSVVAVFDAQATTSPLFAFLRWLRFVDVIMHRFVLDLF